MLKNAFILTFRKLKAHLAAGIIFILGLSVGYVWLVSALYNFDWFSLIASVVILTASSFSGRPIMNKKDFGLYKILGAHRKNIWPLLIIQSSVIAGIVTLLALTLMDLASNRLIVNVQDLLYNDKQWLLIAATLTTTITVCLLHFRLFSKARPTISSHW